MTDFVRCTPEQLGRLVEKRIAKLQKSINEAVEKTIDDAVPAIRTRAPKAFGDLSESVHKEPGKVVVDAPHAGAVEKGSPPHQPDLEKLVAWVKLRGMQGLNRRFLRNPLSTKHGQTTRDQATKIKHLLRAQVQSGAGGKFSPADAPTQVALAIAKGIEQHGTPPHFFVRDSIPVVAMQLAKHVRRSMGK